MRAECSNTLLGVSQTSPGDETRTWRSRQDTNLRGEEAAALAAENKITHYFTYKVCSVGKSCAQRDVTQGKSFTAPCMGL